LAAGLRGDGGGEEGAQAEERREERGEMHCRYGVGLKVWVVGCGSCEGGRKRETRELI
jgi:hypothetical protein